MRPPQAPAYYTVEEYLVLERRSEERHEYLDGEIYAMAGESPDHGAICTNLVRIISTQLLGTPCQAFSKDTKVRSGPTPRPGRSARGLFSYPDLLVVCGELRFHDEYRDVLLNPTVIIEVLSPATELYDLGVKFLCHRTHLPTLTDYVLVSQAMPLIEHYRRLSVNEWVLSTVSDLEGSLALTSIDCALRLAEVYDRVRFPEEAPEPPDTE